MNTGDTARERILLHLKCIGRHLRGITRELRPMKPAMTITPDHWLDNSVRKLLPGGAPMDTRRFLVIHHTCGASGQSSIDFWKTPAAHGACAHIVIERDGTILQCRPFNKTCGHAGESKWKDPKTGQTFIGLNSCSIGIELANAGDADVSWAKKQPGYFSVSAKHKNGGPLTTWEGYPEAQIAACVELSKVLVARYHLDDVVGHEDIAPKRKVDPGPAWPMGRLRLACGFPEKV